MHTRSAAELPRAFPGGLLRRLRISDLAAFQAYRSIPELGRFQAWSPMSEAEAVAFLAEMSEAPLFTPGDWVQLGIAQPETDQLIGDIGIFLAADGRTGELGVTLAPAAQGRGIATAAVHHALQLLFGVSSVKQVLGITDRRNVGSVRLLERVGFRRHESRSTVFRGEPCTEDVYVLPRDDGGKPGSRAGRHGESGSDAMHILEHLFLVGEFPARARLLSGLTLEQVTRCPDGASHSIYEELWHVVAYQQFVLERGDPAGDRYPSAVPEHAHQWHDLVRVFLDGARVAAAMGQAPERLALEVEPGVTMADELSCVAVHNAYHLGKIVALRQRIGAWPPSGEAES